MSNYDDDNFREEEECCIEDDIHFVGEFGTVFFINCGVDVQYATGIEVFLTRPDGTKLRKEAEATTYNNSTNYIKFITEVGDFNQAGTYIGQASMDIGGWRGFGEKFKIKVEETTSSSSSSVSMSSSSSSESA